MTFSPIVLEASIVRHVVYDDFAAREITVPTWHWLTARSNIFGSLCDPSFGVFSLVRNTILPNTHPIGPSTTSVRQTGFGKGKLLAVMAILASTAISGCASYSAVSSEDGDGSYRLTGNGMSYTMSMNALTASSREKAIAWCNAQGKDMQLRQQARSWQPMQVELSFRCVPRQDKGQPAPQEQGKSLTTFK